eukprot:10687409-Prorocentrum_lima.AAC.1
MTSSLVGSEMCIRDRLDAYQTEFLKEGPEGHRLMDFYKNGTTRAALMDVCLLYTSDAADDM